MTRRDPCLEAVAEELDWLREAVRDLPLVLGGRINQSAVFDLIDDRIHWHEGES